MGLFRQVLFQIRKDFSGNEDTAHIMIKMYIDRMKKVNRIFDEFRENAG